MIEFSSLEALLKDLVQRRGVSAPKLARASGLKIRTVNSYLQGERTMPLKTAVQLFGALGVPENAVTFAASAMAMGKTVGLPDPEDLSSDLQHAISVLVEATKDGQRPESVPIPPMGARHARNLPLAVREYLAEFRLRLTKGGATEEEIDEALELMRAPQVFTFYKGGALSEYSEDEVLRGMKAIGESVVIPELRERGRKVQ